MRLKNNRRNGWAWKILLSIIAIGSLALAISLTIFSFRHKPYLYEQTDFTFQDSRGLCYFKNSKNDYLCVYDTSKVNNYELCSFYDDDGAFLYCDSVTRNSQYLIVSLSPYSNSKFSYIRIYDKAFALVDSIKIDDGHVMDLASTDNNLYFTVRKDRKSEYTYSTMNYNLQSQTVEEVICENKDEDYWSNGENKLFIINSYRIQVPKEKMSFIRTYSRKEKMTIWKVCDFRIEVSNNTIKIQNGEYSKSFKAKGKNNKCYEKLALIDNHLIFATYLDVKNYKCGSYDNVSNKCSCGMRESYLYDYDTSSGVLSFIQSFKSGTFLIDYDLENVRYMYKNKLFDNHKETECKNIPIIKEEMWGPFNQVSETAFEYFLSFYDGKFYGVS